MVVECGHHHSSNTKEVAFAHIQKLLNYFEMTERCLVEVLPKPAEQITRYRSTQMIKPNLHFRFILPVETGTLIEANVVYAIDDEGEHKAQEKVWLMMPLFEVKPHDKDAGWLCSRELLSRS